MNTIVSSKFGCIQALVLLASMSSAPSVRAAATEDATRCIDIADDARRLHCYDAALKSPQAPRPGPVADTSSRNVDAVDGNAARGSDAPSATPLLDKRWELSDQYKNSDPHLQAHKPLYLLPAFYTSKANSMPSSPADGRSVTTPLDLQSTEVKFQISLKAKLRGNIFGDNGDLWLGYTQVSHWQFYDNKHSNPFRETNYEPELMLKFRTEYELFGWTGRMFGVDFTHQSNGRALPLSRSWNRAMLDFSFERQGWVVVLRPWWRMSDDKKDDDNPNISDYMGRGDVQIVREWNGHEFALMVRHSLRSGDRSHGALQFDWAFPLYGQLRGHLQLFDGYGESMIDYNHRAWYVGIGLSMLEWY